MSYSEMAMQVIYDKNKKFPDDYPKHKPLTEDEKRANDQIFEIPVYGGILNGQKDVSVKGGKIDKNSAYQCARTTPKCGRHTQNE